MLTHTQNLQLRHVFLPLVVLFLFFPFFSHAQTAVANNGWINFGTSLLSSGSSGCDDDPEEKMILESFVIKDIPANVDIGEVEASLLINGVKANIAMATISVFDTVTGEILNSVTGTGPVIGEVCYNPDTQGVSVNIDGGEYYHDFYHARVWKNPATVTRNVFVQSTIWLRERSDTLKEYAHVSPVNSIVNTDPEYKIDLQYTPNVDIGSYEASKDLWICRWLRLIHTPIHLDPLSILMRLISCMEMAHKPLHHDRYPKGGLFGRTTLISRDHMVTQMESLPQGFLATIGHSCMTRPHQQSHHIAQHQAVVRLL